MHFLIILYHANRIYDAIEDTKYGKERDIKGTPFMDDFP